MKVWTTDERWIKVIEEERRGSGKETNCHRRKRRTKKHVLI